MIQKRPGFLNSVFSSIVVTAPRALQLTYAKSSAKVVGFFLTGSEAPRDAEVNFSLMKILPGG